MLYACMCAIYSVLSCANASRKEQQLKYINEKCKCNIDKRRSYSSCK